MNEFNVLVDARQVLALYRLRQHSPCAESKERAQAATLVDSVITKKYMEKWLPKFFSSSIWDDCCIFDDLARKAVDKIEKASEVSFLEEKADALGYKLVSK